ncbi:MAG: hypothetical protein ACOYH0_05810 [Saccharofermentanales bacterium]|jgi:hypothetical protein
MNIKTNAVLRNRFDIKVVDAKTGDIKQEAVAYNVILDNYFRVRLGLNSNVSMSNGMSYIGVGTGAGTPSTTDTDLFQRLALKSAAIVEEVYQYPTSHITRQIKLNADEYNGSIITEVGMAFHYSAGMWGNDYWLMATHAMLQDSEGNQISIEKTSIDVVYINATFFCTYTPSGFGDNAIHPDADNNVLVKWLLRGNYNYTAYSNRYPLEKSNELSSQYQYSKGYNFSLGAGNFETLTYELPLITILDSEWNNHVVKNLGIPGIGAFQFPDPSVFPDYAINHLVVGEGDGAKTEFNIGCPLIKEGSVHVFVGGAELAAGAFEVDHGSNCVDCRENYHTARMRVQDEGVSFGDIANRSPNNSYRYQDPLSWFPYPISEKLYPASCVVSAAYPIVIDFGEGKECNVLRIDNRNINVSYINSLVIEHSNDNVNWTAVTYTREDNEISSSYTLYKWTWNLVSARYWRVYIPGYSWTYYLFYQNNLGNRDGTSHIYSTFFLGKSVPGLRLMTPPANGEAVEVSYTLDIPFKTSNNILKMTCSIQLQRG